MGEGKNMIKRTGGKRENKYDKDRRRVGMKEREKSEYTDERQMKAC